MQLIYVFEKSVSELMALVLCTYCVVGSVNNVENKNNNCLQYTINTIAYYSKYTIDQIAQFLF